MRSRAFLWSVAFGILILGVEQTRSETGVKHPLNDASASSPSKSASIEIDIPQHHVHIQNKHKHVIIVNGTEVRCAPSAIEEFPKPMLNAEMRAKGAVLVHIFVAIAMILSISVLCKEYFVPALHCIINILEIDSDVAGGTMMAAASSIPALVTSVIGINIVENDLGVSTTLGSGVLNAAGVLSISALFAKRSVEIHKWPLFRSSFFFLLCMLVMIGALVDSQVDWVEAAICVGCYVWYIVVMIFNRRLEKLFKCCTGIRDLDDPDNTDPHKQSDGTYATYNPENPAEKDGHLPTVTEKIEKPKPRKSISEDGVPFPTPNPEDEPMIDPKAWENLNMPRRIFFVVTYPFSLVLSFFIPNCKKERWRRWYMATFLLSGGFIAAFSYILVWMMAIIGFTLGIPDSVLGLTFMSISVTLPDVMASVLVVRKGYGDMAVCYVLGTNIFEVLIGLGLPWLVQTTILKPGSTVELQSEGLLYSAGCVLFTVFLVPALTFATRWKMNKTYGVVLLLWYLIFMVLSCMYQMNVFDNSNPPSCGSTY